MPLYQAVSNDPTLRWRFELDAAKLILGKDLFFAKGEPLAVDQNMLDIVWERRILRERPGLRNGPLSRLVRIELEGTTGARVCLTDSSYQEHHVTMPIQGQGADQFSTQYEQLAPHLLAAQMGVPINEIAPAFALAVLVETSDHKLVYCLRNANVDCYKDAWSLPSGGRISGNPHEFNHDIITDPKNIYPHIAKLLSLEFPGASELEQRLDASQTRFTGILRSLLDFDTTGTVYAKVDITASELMTGVSPAKYKGAAQVDANSDGIMQLLKGYAQFPATVFGAIVMSASQYGIDPTTLFLPMHSGVTVRIREIN